jgi:hypothetical protein
MTLIWLFMQILCPGVPFLNLQRAYRSQGVKPKTGGALQRNKFPELFLKLQDLNDFVGRGVNRASLLLRASRIANNDPPHHNIALFAVTTAISRVQLALELSSHIRPETIFLCSENTFQSPVPLPNMVYESRISFTLDMSMVVRESIAAVEEKI